MINKKYKIGDVVEYEDEEATIIGSNPDSEEYCLDLGPTFDGHEGMTDWCKGLPKTERCWVVPEDELELVREGKPVAVSTKVRTLATKNNSATLKAAHDLALAREEAETNLNEALEERKELNERIKQLRGLLK